MHKEVVILGAGPGGLAAGLYLARNGVRPIVIEKEDRVAGLCRTLTDDGNFFFDIGGHRWFTRNEMVDQFVKELMGPEFIRVGRSSRIYFNGKYYHYPISLKNVLRNLGLIRSGRAVMSFLAAQISSPPAVTMEQAYVKQFGRTIYESFFLNYSEKVWGRKCNELSADWVAQRTKGLSILDLLEKIFLRRKTMESLVEEFWYPKKGFGRISERMAEEITSLGGKVLLEKTVSRISCKENRITEVHCISKDGAVEVIPADTVISTIPLNLLLKMMDPPPDESVLRETHKLQFRDLITVNLKLKRDQVTDDTWMYVHDPEIPFARLHEPRNWSRDMAPEGHTSLVVEYFCDVGDPMWNKSDEELCKITVDQLADKLGFIQRGEVIGSFAFRARRAYPVYSLDYKKILGRIQDYLKGISGLQIVGRAGTFQYNNSDHSIEMGILSARNVLGENHRIDAVNSAQEYLEEKPLQRRLTSV